MIITGVYKAGDMVPSEFELVEKEKLSRQTVRQALALLEQEGRISRRRGKRLRCSEQRLQTRKNEQCRAS
jgi:DNA-binding GntR family transcriptional regulator